jgi:hypothetical protein
VSARSAARPIPTNRWGCDTGWTGHATSLVRGRCLCTVLPASAALPNPLGRPGLRARPGVTGSPILSALVDGDPLASEITLTNGLSIMCFPCTLRSMRGCLRLQRAACGLGA